MAKSEVVLDFMKGQSVGHLSGWPGCLLQALTRFEFEGCLRLIGHNGIISTTGACNAARWKSRFLNHVQKSGSSLGLQNLYPTVQWQFQLRQR